MFIVVGSHVYMGGGGGVLGGSRGVGRRALGGSPRYIATVGRISYLRNIYPPTTGGGEEVCPRAYAATAHVTVAR